MLNYFEKVTYSKGLVNLNQSPFPENILYLSGNPSEIISGLIGNGYVILWTLKKRLFIN